MIYFLLIQVKALCDCSVFINSAACNDYHQCLWDNGRCLKASCETFVPSTAYKCLNPDCFWNEQACVPFQNCKGIQQDSCHRYPGCRLETITSCIAFQNCNEITNLFWCNIARPNQNGYKCLLQGNYCLTVTQQEYCNSFGEDTCALQANCLFYNNQCQETNCPALSEEECQKPSCYGRYEEVCTLSKCAWTGKKCLDCWTHSHSYLIGTIIVLLTI